MKTSLRKSRYAWLVASCFVGAAAAADSSAPVWHCWYGSHVDHLTCFQPAPPSGIRTDLDIGRANELAQDLMRQHDYVGATRLFRRYPGAFRGETKLIPIYTVPFDLESVEVLATSVMCPRSSCKVAFDRTWSGVNAYQPRQGARRVAITEWQ